MNSSLGKSGCPAAVDIVIPYYRALSYLREAVQSIQSQTFTNFRLHIIDDSPNDLLAEEFITNLDDPRISYTSNQINLGLNKTLNYAVEHCEADWVVFLGHDDCLLPEYLESMLSVCEQYPTAAIVQSQTLVINNLGENYRPLVDQIKNLIQKSCTSSKKHKDSFNGDRAPTLINHRNAMKLIAIGNFLYFPLIMWKREFLTKATFRLDLLVTSDIEILFKIFLLKGDLLLINKVLGKYRRHNASLSENPATKLNRLKEESSTYSAMSKMLKPEGFRSASFLCLLRPSTRLYSFYETAISLITLHLHRAAQFMWLGIR